MITLAVGNVIGDLGGLICDGAKPGLTMKAVTAVDTAVRSALMALKGYGLGVATAWWDGRSRIRSELQPNHPGRHVPSRSHDAPHPSGQSGRERKGLTCVGGAR